VFFGTLVKMQTDRNKILVESIKRLLRRGATTHLVNIVNKTHAADLSVVFRSLSLSQQRELFDMITDIEQKGILFSELDEDTFCDFIAGIELEAIVEILEEMPNDDVADLLGRLPEEKSKTILEKMRKEESEEVEDLLRYEDDTAGGIMVRDFIALTENTLKLKCLFIFMLSMITANWSGLVHCGSWCSSHRIRRSKNLWRPMCFRFRRIWTRRKSPKSSRVMTS